MKKINICALKPGKSALAAAYYRLNHSIGGFMIIIFYLTIFSYLQFAKLTINPQIYNTKQKGDPHL
jgi:hypothetical protein